MKTKILYDAKLVKLTNLNIECLCLICTERVVNICAILNSFQKCRLTFSITEKNCNQSRDAAFVVLSGHFKISTNCFVNSAVKNDKKVFERISVLEACLNHFYIAQHLRSLDSNKSFDDATLVLWN